MRYRGAWGKLFFFGIKKSSPLSTVDNLSTIVSIERMVYNKNGLPKQTLLRISFVIFMTRCVEQSYSLVTCPRRVSGFSPTKSARKHNIDLVRHDLKGGNRLQNRIVMNLSKGVDNDNDNNDENNQKITKKFLERNKNWIILVDDEEAIRSAVGDFLYDSGYQVTACADAEALPPEASNILCMS